MNTLDSMNILADYYAAHREELVRFVVSRIGRNDIAKDVVQDAFARLLTTDKMITPVTLPCLVYTTVRNLMCDYWRHHHAVEAYEHYLCHSGCRVEDAESVYSVREVTELLEKSIARLTSRQREVYVLSIYQGMKVSEISETLHINYKSVENRLGGARKQVRSYFKARLAI